MKKTIYSISAIILIFLYSCTSQNTTSKKDIALPNAPGTTSNAESLIRETNDAGNEFYPRVSPDGKFLLYSLQENTTNSKVIKIVKKEIGIPVTNPLLTEGGFGNWYPDGKNVVFSYRKPTQPVIVKTNGDGVGLNYISQSAMGSDDSNPNVTADNTTVIFTTLIGTNRMICSMDSRGGKFTVITDGDNVAVNPKNSNEIIYNLKVNNTSQIFSMDIKSGRKTQLTTGDFNCRDGAFSTDGDWIAFASNREDPKSNRYHIYVMKTDGTELKQLTQGDTIEGDPSWSINGEVFFYSNADNNYNIWSKI